MHLFTDKTFYGNALVVSKKMSAFFEKKTVMKNYIEIYSKILERDLKTSV